MKTLIVLALMSSSAMAEPFDSLKFNNEPQTRRVTCIPYIDLSRLDDETAPPTCFYEQHSGTAPAPSKPTPPTPTRGK